jgi:hypothetical protein
LIFSLNLQKVFNYAMDLVLEREAPSTPNPKDKDGDSKNTPGKKKKNGCVLL